MRKILLFPAAVIVALFTTIGVAGACHPEVTAESVCIDGTNTVLRVHSEAWQTDDENARYNGRVEVYIEGFTATDLAYTPENNYSFTIDVGIPAEWVGKAIPVTVAAIDPWGPNGEYGQAGTATTFMANVFNNCPVPVPTAPEAPIVPVELVEPAVVTPSWGDGCEAAGTCLAFTGTETVRNVAIGATLLVGGLGLVLISKRRGG